MSTLVHLENICFRYDLQGPWTIDRVSLDLHAGEALGVIGPNGAGKSTLLEILLGAVKPESGQVVRSQTLRIGYLPQMRWDRRQIPISVGQVVSLGMKNGAWKKWVELLSITSLLDKRFCDLSGGEQQRVLLARALVNDPQLLVLDEPLSMVDFHGRESILGHLKQWRKSSQAAMVMVSHDLEQVLKNCDRVACLNRCIHFHDKSELLNQQIIQQTFTCEIGHGILTAAHKHHPEEDHHD